MKVLTAALAALGLARAVGVFTGNGREVFSSVYDLFAKRFGPSLSFFLGTGNGRIGSEGHCTPQEHGRRPLT